MGFALPAAIGVKVARPEAEVWVVVGRWRLPDDVVANLQPLFREKN